MATSMSSSQGIKPLWRTAPRRVPAHSIYGRPCFLQTRSSSDRRSSSMAQIFFRRLSTGKSSRTSSHRKSALILPSFTSLSHSVICFFLFSFTGLFLVEIFSQRLVAFFKIYVLMREYVHNGHEYDLYVQP